jgi:hypothetical protein
MEGKGSFRQLKMLEKNATDIPSGVQAMTASGLEEDGGLKVR